MAYRQVMTIRAIISANLTARLKAKRWSQQELFRRSGVSQATIGRIIRKEVDPDIETVSRLAEKLGCKAWELLIPENPHKQVGNDISSPPNTPVSDRVQNDPAAASLVASFRQMNKSNQLRTLLECQMRLLDQSPQSADPFEAIGLVNLLREGGNDRDSHSVLQEPKSGGNQGAGNAVKTCKK